jgi:thiol-disulfide isomerase/thioredoxin
VALTLSSVARAQTAGAAYKIELTKGTEALKHSQLDEAIDAFKRAAKSPDQKDAAAAYVGMAVAYYRQAEYKKAIDSCDAALKRTGDDRVTEAQARNVRGFSLAASAKDANDRRLKEAEAEYRAAIAASDLVWSARFNLGKTLLRLNRDEEGIAELKAFLERESSGRQAEEARRLIENPNRARANYAPDFSFTSRGGERISLAGLQGKAVLLDFWGSWCGPCVEATPGLSRIAKKFAGSPLVILGIARDKRDNWNAFIEKHKMDWPQYLDESREMEELFGIGGYPTYIIIDPEGTIRGHRRGYGPGTDAWIESEIRKALNLK